ncbi:MAG TPA: hemolysin family protein [Bacteroidales bacterium]|nr:hemolysin family protein [Bacteroidales bacterium]HPS61719.1 hemolysin family protein [Bacteroidales bacterium]
MLTALTILLILFLVNGCFVMAEIAIVSARKTRLELDAKQGDKRAQLALENAANPNRFLSTIQIAVTLIGILTGVYSSDEIAHSLTGVLTGMGVGEGLSHSLALTIVVILVTFVSMLIGELVPKRIGLTNPEKVAKAMVLPLMFVTRLAYPFTFILTRAGDAIIWLLRIKPTADSRVTEEEIKAMVQEGTEDGEVQEIEQDIVQRVFHLGDRKISSLMTHHSDLEWFDIQDSPAEIREKISESLHSVYPVCEDDLDKVLGVIYIKDLVLDNMNSPGFSLHDRIRPAQFVHESLTAYDALELFKQNKIHYGLVVDEYGSTVGMVTLNDILEALVGDFNEPSPDEPRVVLRDDGSWLVDGQMPFYEFAYEFNISGFDKNKVKFDTLAGLAMSILKQIPKPGEKFTWKEYEFEVVDLDGNRIDKLIIKKTGD